MNLRTKQKGFTIVELLIVVVVIAILAAISIVAYTGITNRANRSAAMEAANSVKSVAAAYQGANNNYPTSREEFISGGTEAIAKMPDDIEFLTTNMTDGNAPGDPKSLYVESHGSPITGFTIHYYDFVDNKVEEMTVGDTTGNGTVVPQTSP